jgi:hypothetical protein
MRIKQRITPAKVSLSGFISAFETEWNRMAHVLQSSTASSSKNSKPQHEAKAVSLSNGKQDNQKKKGSSSSSNSDGKECN